MNYKVNISHPYKFIWMTSPKTASQSTTLFFLNYNMIVEQEVNHKQIKNNRRYIFDTVIPNKYNNYIFIASCRNPYSRMVSLFKMMYAHDWEKLKISPAPTFPNSPLNHKTCNQFQHLGGNLGQIDYFIHLETIEEDLLKLPFIETISKLKHRNKSPIKKSWQEYYKDPKIQEKIYEKLKEEFLYFGYSKEIEWL